MEKDLGLVNEAIETKAESVIVPEVGDEGEMIGDPALGSVEFVFVEICGGGCGTRGEGDSAGGHEGCSPVAGGSC